MIQQSRPEELRCNAGNSHQAVFGGRDHKAARRLPNFDQAAGAAGLSHSRRSGLLKFPRRRAEEVARLIPHHLTRRADFRNAGGNALVIDSGKLESGQRHRPAALTGDLIAAEQQCPPRLAARRIFASWRRHAAPRANASCPYGAASPHHASDPASGTPRHSP